MINTSAFDLFPVPSNPPSVTCPNRSPGISPESTKTLRDVLKVNHETWDICIDDYGRHNHISHHALALWALGAQKEFIKAGYEKDTVLQRPATKVPETITQENFYLHIGDRKYYPAYTKFFTEMVKQKEFGELLEEYIFSPKANFGSTNASGEHPEMFNRFLASVIHPMIHVGYGIEFGLPGMIVEGLAETTFHPKDSSPILPEAFFDSVWKTANEGPNQMQPSVHAFTIVARILKDPKSALPEKPNPENMYLNVTSNEAIVKSLYEHVSQWTMNASDPKEVERKIEEIQWLTVLLYAIPGADTKDVEFNADFVNMHFVTASLFLPSLVTCLSPMSQVLLLRGFLTVILAWWIANSRPSLNIAAFFATNIADTLPSGPSSAKHKDAVSSPVATGNAWLPLMQDAIIHPDDHYAKLIRALAHFSVVYGSREAGYFAGTELEGAELLDGTLFVRTAGLTARRLARTTPNEFLVYFDFMGFYENRK